MQIRPVTLDGLHVRLEPLSLAHVPALWRAGEPDEIWRYLSSTVRFKESPSQQARCISPTPIVQSSLMARAMSASVNPSTTAFSRTRSASFSAIEDWSMSVSSTVFTEVIENSRAGHAACETSRVLVDRSTRHGSIMRISGRVRNQYLC